MSNFYLEGPEVTQLVLKARQLKESGKVFSDIMDHKGHYYVDFVQQGGGMLGLALTGYTYILEQAGIRFYSMAGSSAGAINALMMAGLKPVGQPVSVCILNILNQKNLFDLLDGPSRIKRLLEKQIKGKPGLVWRLIWNACKIYHLLTSQLGLNPGKDLEQWLTTELKANNITTYADLLAFRKTLPLLRHRLKEDLQIASPKLAMITSEITTHTRVELPKMASLYWKDSSKINPAEFAHTSMAVPYLFYPFEKKNIPHSGENATPAWQRFAGYYGKIPKKVKFVDGGLLSNFPINVFHIGGIPAKPTFGARLSTFRREYSTTKTLFEFSEALISTMRQIHDYEVILKNPDYRQLICNIDADKRYNWLDFNMTKEDKKGLFILGAQKGLAFLEQFDWEFYKKTRQNLIP